MFAVRRDCEEFLCGTKGGGGVVGSERREISVHSWRVNDIFIISRAHRHIKLHDFSSMRAVSDE